MYPLTPAREIVYKNVFTFAYNLDGWLQSYFHELQVAKTIPTKIARCTQTNVNHLEIRDSSRSCINESFDSKAIRRGNGLDGFLSYKR